MLPAHFSLTVKSLHRHWVLQVAPTVTRSHRWLFTARQLYQWSPPRRTSAGVTDVLSTPRLWTWDFKLPPPPPPHPHTSVPLKLNMHTIMYLLLVFLCSTRWHVPFFCFFCKFGCRRNTEKKNHDKNNKQKKEKKTHFQTAEGEVFGVSTTLIRDVEKEILPEDHPEPSRHRNIQ